MTKNPMPVLFSCLSLAVLISFQAAGQAPPTPVGKSLKASGTKISRDPVVKNAATGDDRGIPEKFIIGEGDVLQVSVWKEPDASVPSMVVRADGKITVPFIKEVVVAGMTAAQAEEMIAAKLKPFIMDPDVTVVVREVHSKKIYLVGAVRKTGAVEMTHPMTVLQALTEAGGPNDFAKKKDIYVLRTSNGAQVKLPFNYDAAIKGEQTGKDYWLMPNDMVIVPQ
jgi:polysaccharide export outer membrane protein